jgi:hypothetical protein
VQDGDRRAGGTVDRPEQAVALEIQEVRQAQLLIREGLRMVLRGLEELWGLPRSFETKSEQGRR